MLRFVVPLFLFTSAAVAQPATITGTLTGADGEPLPVAHVHLFSPGGEARAASVPVGSDGRFTVRADETDGFVVVRFTGLHHRALDLPLYLDAGSDVELTARLATLPLAADFPDVRVRGDFPGAGRRLHPRPDGTFAGTFATPADTLAYELSGVTAADRLVPGTDWDRLAVVDGGAYVAVLDAPGDSVTITFDPSLLPRSNALPVVDFAEPNGRAARTAAVLQTLDNRSERVFQVRRCVLEETRGAAPEERAEALAQAMEPFGLTEEDARLAAAIAEEAGPAVRQALLLSYVSVETDLDAKDPALGLQALNEIGTDGRLWGLYPSLVQRALDFAVRADSAATAAWARTLIQQHPDPEVRAYALLRGLDAADAAGDEGAAQGYYTLLQDDAYAETQPGLIASALFARYDPDGAIAVGARVPDFSLPLLDAEGTVSRESLLGRVYLLDFWAVWCLPCIEEMPTLHAAYERFHDEGFEIVSLSFDDSPEEVRTFREAEFPMPWLHAHVATGFAGDLARRFEVRGLPKPILVGPDGRILALSSGELRGVLLERTLARIYGED